MVLFLGEILTLLSQNISYNVSVTIKYKKSPHSPGDLLVPRLHMKKLLNDKLGKIFLYKPRLFEISKCNAELNLFQSGFTGLFDIGLIIAIDHNWYKEGFVWAAFSNGIGLVQTQEFYRIPGSRRKRSTT